MKAAVVTKDHQVYVIPIFMLRMAILVTKPA